MNDRKVHFKMYKDGKRWIVAGIALMSFGLSTVVTNNNNDALADDTNQANATSSAGSGATLSSASVVLQSSADSSNTVQSDSVATSQNSGADSSAINQADSDANSSASSVSATSSTSTGVTAASDAATSSTTPASVSSTSSLTTLIDPTSADIKAAETSGAAAYAATNTPQSFDAIAATASVTAPIIPSGVQLGLANFDWDAATNGFTWNDYLYITYGSQGVMNLTPYMQKFSDSIPLYGFYIVVPTSLTVTGGLNAVQNAANNYLKLLQSINYTITSLTAVQLPDTTDGREVYYIAPNSGANNWNADSANNGLPQTVKEQFYLPITTASSSDTVPDGYNVVVNAGTTADMGTQDVLLAGWSDNNTPLNADYQMITPSSMGMTDAYDNYLYGLTHSAYTTTMVYTVLNAKDTYTIIDESTGATLNTISTTGAEGSSYTRTSVGTDGGSLDTLAGLGITGGNYDASSITLEGNTDANWATEDVAYTVPTSEYDPSTQWVTNADTYNGSSYTIYVKETVPTTNITVSGGGKIYDGQSITDDSSSSFNPVLTITSPVDGSLLQTITMNSNDYTITGTDVNEINAGSYAITLTAQGIIDLEAANPTWSFTSVDPTAITNTYTITKKPATVTVTSINHTYDGKVVNPVATSTGVINGETIGIVSFNPYGPDVGSETVTPLDDGSSVNDNYEITWNSGTITIIAAEITPGTPNTPTDPVNPKDPSDNTPTPGTTQDLTGVTIIGAAKVYDGSATTDPTTYTVQGPSSYDDFVIPTLTDADFDLSGITSQNVGSYQVKLSAVGLKALQDANPNYDFDASDIQNALFVITPAAVKITANNNGKVYGTTDPTLTAQVSGVPTNGDAISASDYTVTRAAGENIGNYDETVVYTGGNANYKVSVEPGQFTITAAQITPPTDPNTPTDPVNPTDPGNNTPDPSDPQAMTGITIIGNTKTYDGDTTTDPTTYTVQGPSSYDDFVIPTLTDADFDLSGITSQNVGSYQVKLSAVGLKALQDANPNYDFDASDIQNALFVITPAAVKITANDNGKVYGTTDPTLTAKVSGVPTKGDAINTADYTVTRAAGENIGNYDETVVYTGGNANYKVSVEPGKFTITAAQITPPTDPNTPTDPVNPTDPGNNTPDPSDPQAMTGITIIGNTKTYDGDTTTDLTTYTVQGPSSYDDFVIPTLTDADFDLSGITSQNVGSYQVKLSAVGLKALQDANPNYDFDASDIQNALFVITPAAVTITANDNGKVYGTTDPTLTAQVSGVPTNGDAISASDYAVTRAAGENIGNYDETVVYTGGNANYKVSVKPGQFTITAAQITPPTDPNTPTDPVNPTDPGNNTPDPSDPQAMTGITIIGNTKTYDGDATTDPTTYTVQGPSSYDDFVIPTLTDADFDLSGITSQNVGSYQVKLSAVGLKALQDANPNYDFDASDIQNALFVITPAAVKITANNNGKVYGTTDPTLTAQVSGVPTNGDAISASDYTVTRAAGENIGNYDETVVYTGGNANYKVSVEPGQFTITAAQITPPTDPNTPTDPVNPTDPGNNTPDPSDPQAMTGITIIGNTKTYDGDTTTDPTTYTVQGPSSYDDFVIPTLTDADFDLSGITSQNVGSYQVKLSAVGLKALQDANPNYDFDASDIQNALFVITPAAVTITANDNGKVYGTTDPTLTAQVSGVPTNGDAISASDYAVTRAAGENIGNYDETVVYTGGNANYKVSVKPGQFTITAAQITPPTDPNTPTDPVNPTDPGNNTPDPSDPQAMTGITIIGNTKTYDGDTTTDPTTYTVQGPSSYDDFVIPTLTDADFDLSGITSQNVGSYQVKLSAVGLKALQDANPNYDFDASDIQNALFVITPAAVTITANDNGKVYGTTDPTLTAQVSGVPTNGDAISASDYAVTRAAGENIGNYDETVVYTGGNANYKVSVKPGQFTITAAQITPPTDPNTPTDPVNPTDPGNNTPDPSDPQAMTGITIIGNTKTYDGDTTTDPTTYTVQGPSSYDDFVIPTLTDADFDLSGITSQNVGSYQVKLSAVGLKALQDANPNYDFDASDIQNALFVITPAAVTITANDNGKVYGTTDPTLTAQVSGVPTNGDAISASDYTVTRAAGENIGNYDETVVYTGGNANYKVSVEPGQFTIAAAQITPPTDPNTPTDPVNPTDPGNNTPDPSDPQAMTGITIIGNTKTYDGDTTTDPTTYTVQGPSSYDDFVIPTLTDADFDLSGITSQNVGSYQVKLSAVGLKALQDANPNYDFDASDIQNALFVITPAAVTITANDNGKVYGTTDPTLTAQVSGVPTNGDAISASDYAVTRAAGENIGNYDETVVYTGGNANYKVSVEPGQFTIAAAQITPPTDPNTPTDPVNPTDPGNNTPDPSDPQAMTGITIIGNTKTYDGDTTTDPTTYTVQGPSSYDDFVIPTLTDADFDLSGITSQNVGSYQVKLSAVGLKALQDANPNYDFDASDIQNALFVITPAAVTITANDNGKVYGTTDPMLTAQVSGVPTNGDAISASDYAVTRAAGENIGNYDETVVYTGGNANYKVSVKPGQFTITAAQITSPTDPNTPTDPVNPTDPGNNTPDPSDPQAMTGITIIGNTKTYDGDTTTDPTTYTVQGPSSYDDFVIPTLTDADFDLSGITSQNVGSYQVKLSAVGLKALQDANPNYDFDASDIQNALFVITPAAVTITANDNGKVYGTTDPMLTAQVSGVPTNGDAISASDYAVTRAAGENIGNYDETVVYTGGNANYKVSVKPGQFTITAAQITPPTDPNTPTDPVNPTDPGNNTPDPSDPQAMTGITIIGNTKTYDGDTTTDPTTYTVQGPSSYDDFVIPTLTDADFDLSGITSQNVGSYQVKLSAVGLKALQDANPNYDFDASDIQNALFVITPAAVTITANDNGKVYGTTDPTLTAQVSGVPTNGDAISASDYAVTRAAGENIGNYDETVVYTGGNANYKVSVKPGQFTITAAQITPPTDPNTPTDPVNPTDPGNNTPDPSDPQAMTGITIIGNTKTYDGDATTDPTTYTVQGPSSYDDFVIPTLTDADFDLSGITSQNVGSYQVKLSAVGLKALQDANPNYDFDASDIQNALFVITPAAVTITANDNGKVYGTTDPTLTAQVSGVPTNGDAISASDYTVTRAAGENIGNYDETVVYTGGNANYKVSVEPGQFTITPALVDSNQVFLTDGSKVYDGKTIEYTPTLSVTLPDGTSLSSVVLTPDDYTVVPNGSNTNDEATNAGTYSIELNTNGITKLENVNSNYDFTGITPSDVTAVYNIEAIIVVQYLKAGSTDVLAEGYQENGNIGISYTTSEKIISGYTIVPMPANASGNYTKNVDTVTYYYTVNYTVTPVDPNGNPIPGASTGTGTGNPGNPIDPGSTPSVPGYTATPTTDETVPNEPGNVDVTYTPDTKNVLVHYDVVGTTTAIVPDQTVHGAYGTDYSTEAKTINGYTLVGTPTNATGTYGLTNGDVTYYYTVNYTVTPVDPNGNPIPGVSTGTGTGNPGDPIDSGSTPSVPGYTATPTTDETVPNEPGNVDVTYTPDQETVVVHYKVVGTNSTAAAGRTITGAFGDGYTTTPLSINGYTWNGVTPANATGTYGTSNDDVTYYYTVNYNIVPVDPNGNPIPGTTTTPETGTPGEPIKVPNIPGYIVKVIPNVPDQPGDVTVVYVKIPSTKPTTPAQPITTATPTVIPTKVVQRQETNLQPVVQNHAESKRLPQTGEKDSAVSEVVGLSLLLSVFSFFGIKRRRHEEK
ncbi:LPXTG-motif protein cell wall anchor domain protein [Paucilactobacillus hokkaidonensis JCM 18461]|uniref:LPXTG-motif protein cell wall anchor domain protein n=6 Tax=Paucilactobacillus hokkaidonensis TaxID=1193095 RepID=A0A0A1GW46_9LACO|nr:MBG domain-containing protein [Paucilactobacillus hokkaidonensis]BAP86200.1 LPXTG-motif protein cell wall anchor domain protein [Paucilactobacillus hokkaidonensis JCM 18461]